MENIRAVLWDVDGTLLNFLAAEKAAIRECFRRFDLGECTDAMLARYSAINRGYWEKIERGEIGKPRALVARFEDFFSGEGLPTGRAEAFNDEYQVRLGDTVVFEHGAREAVEALLGRVKQYAVTNGTATAQRRKLKNSGLDKLLDGVFISEDIGVEKPDAAFFDHVFRQMSAFARVIFPLLQNFGFLEFVVDKDNILIFGKPDDGTVEIARVDGIRGFVHISEHEIVKILSLNLCSGSVAVKTLYHDKNIIIFH